MRGETFVVVVGGIPGVDTVRAVDDPAANEFLSLIFLRERLTRDCRKTTTQHFGCETHHARRLEEILQELWVYFIMLKMLQFLV